MHRGTVMTLLLLLQLSACNADEIQEESPDFSNNTPPGGQKCGHTGECHHCKAWYTPVQCGKRPAGFCSFGKVRLESVSAESALGNPWTTWLVFKRNSNKGGNKRTKSPKKTSKHGVPGPPGPPGPQGPPGPPAPSSKEPADQLKEFRLKLKEVVAINGPLEIGTHCQVCEQHPRVDTAFHCRLLNDLPIPRRSLQEIQPFSSPADSEQLFQRGQDFNRSSGRYTAPVSGFYYLTANLLIETSDVQRRSTSRQRDCITVSICIESLCHSNMSLTAMSGVGDSAGVFSILVTGTLFLQAGEYASVFIDNGTGSALTVQKGTVFSGILLGF